MNVVVGDGDTRPSPLPPFAFLFVVENVVGSGTQLK
jgi:hypothetical protein